MLRPIHRKGRFYITKSTSPPDHFEENDMLNHKQKYPNILKIFIILILVTPVLVMVLPTVVANAGPWVSDGVSYGSESASSDTFEIKTDSMPVVITWVLEIVFLLILCILWLVCAILNAVTNGLIGGYLDTIILQGTGVSQESSTLINFYTFRLANKNIY